MKPSLIDTDIISFFLRHQENVRSNFEKYLKEYTIINISILTYYEIISGLKYKDAQKQLNSFLRLASFSTVLPLTEDSVENSADIYSYLCKKSELIEDIDILIAGIAISNNLVLVTKNTSHFDRIKGLAIEDWSTSLF